MKKSLLAVNTTIAILILIISCIGFFIKNPITGQTYVYSENADFGWLYKDGTPANLSHLNYRNNETSVSRTIDANKMQSTCLCFTSSTAYFSVYLDDTLIYDFHPKVNAIYGNTYGSAFHTIPIPSFTGTAVLTLKAENPIDDPIQISFYNARFDDSFHYLFDYFSSNLIPFFISFFSLIVGFGMMILGLIFNSHREQKPEMISLGCFSLCLSLWILSSSEFLGLLCGNPAAARLIDFTTLMLFPFFGVVFLACVLKNTQSRLLLVSLFYTIINVTFQFYMCLRGYADYHDMLPFSHAGFLLSILLCVILLIQNNLYSGAKKKKEKKASVIITTSAVILIASGIADLISYYIAHPSDNARFTRFGLFFFLLLLLYYETGEFITAFHQTNENDLTRQLVHRDGLTSLENRLAFNEYERELESRKKGVCTITLFDINNMKNTNDTFGHINGDQIIRSFASFLSATFGKYGRVFRIGGDEFIAILYSDHGDVSSQYSMCIKKLMSSIRRHNTNTDSANTLSIAYGTAHCDFSKDTLVNQEILADNRMYEQKRKIKRTN